MSLYLSICDKDGSVVGTVDAADAPLGALTHSIRFAKMQCGSLESWEKGYIEPADADALVTEYKVNLDPEWSKDPDARYLCLAEGGDTETMMNQLLWGKKGGICARG